MIVSNNLGDSEESLFVFLLSFQAVTPFAISTHMTGYQKPNLITLTPEKFVKTSLAYLKAGDKTFGSIPHTIMVYLYTYMVAISCNFVNYGSFETARNSDISKGLSWKRWNATWSRFNLDFSEACHLTNLTSLSVWGRTCLIDSVAVLKLKNPFNSMNMSKVIHYCWCPTNKRKMHLWFRTG